MLHVVPILCLIFFIFLVEYRFNKHLEDVEKTVKDLREKVNKLINERIN